MSAFGGKADIAPHGAPAAYLDLGLRCSPGGASPPSPTMRGRSRCRSQSWPT